MFSVVLLVGHLYLALIHPTTRHALRGVTRGDVRVTGRASTTRSGSTVSRTPVRDNAAMATVLVVDDEPIVRDVVVRYLQREGFDTLEAGDGDTARTLDRAEDPELVVLDLMLPGTDGLSLCRWIRSRGDLPVIMLTARGEAADRIVGLEVGADDYVSKPFSAARARRCG